MGHTISCDEKVNQIENGLPANEKGNGGREIWLLFLFFFSFFFFFFFLLL